jgi:hypothetical protein
VTIMPSKCSTPQSALNFLKRPAAILDTNAPQKDWKNQKKKHNLLDQCLAPVCELIVSQQPVIQLTISNSAVDMLLAPQLLCAKQAGILFKRMDKFYFPHSISLKMKLEYPDKMKNNARSIANSQD